MESKFSVLLLIAVLCMPESVLAGTFIGNSGEGVEIGSKVFLRDLYENDEYLKPAFGTEKSNAVLRYSSLGDFEPLRELLAEKIQDLDIRFTGLGHLLFQAFKMHKWVFVEGELETILEGDEQLILPEHSRQIQIANRLGQTIKISRRAWRKMEPSQQVALILHEMSFSLLVPSCSMNICSQPAWQVRELVARYFDHPSTPLDVSMFANLISLRFGLVTENQLQSFMQPHYWKFFFQQQSNCDSPQTSTSSDAKQAADVSVPPADNSSNAKQILYEVNPNLRRPQVSPNLLGAVLIEGQTTETLSALIKGLGLRASEYMSKVDSKVNCFRLVSILEVPSSELNFEQYAVSVNSDIPSGSQGYLKITQRVPYSSSVIFGSRSDFAKWDRLDFTEQFASVVSEL